MKRLVLSLLLLLTIQGPARATTTELHATITLDQFVQKTRQHIERVERLGMTALQELKRRLPAEFAHISEEKVRAFLRLHDQAKVNSDPEFQRRHGLPHRPTVAQSLHRFYGADLADLEKHPSARFGGMRGRTETLGDDFRRLRATFNRVDQEVAAEFLRDLSPADRQKLLLIEMVADGVDTAITRSAEFNRVMTPAGDYYAQKLAKGELDKLGAYKELLPGLARHLERTFGKRPPCLGLMQHLRLVAR